MKTTNLILIVVFAGFFANAFADAPVEDFSTDMNQPVEIASPDASQQQVAPPAVAGEVGSANLQQPAQNQGFSATPSKSKSQNNVMAPAPSTIDTANLSVEERVSHLERQIDNINKTNYQGRIDDLQQQLQKISGDLEIQAHDLQQLQQQVHSLYEDLDRRIGGINAVKNSTAAAGDAGNNNDGIL